MVGGGLSGIEHAIWAEVFDVDLDIDRGEKVEGNQWVRVKKVVDLPRKVVDLPQMGVFWR